MDIVAIRILIMIGRFQHPRCIARKQSLTSNSQARASCAQAAGRAGADPGQPGRADPPFALAAGAG
jgi:hypothetical protein